MANNKSFNSIIWDDYIKKIFKKGGILFAFILLCIILAIISPGFLSYRNFINVIRQSSIIGYMGIGMTFVILTGGIDLSVGSVLALGGVLAAGMLDNGLFIAVIVALLAGLMIGLINGFIITMGNVRPFIVTLGMMLIARGIALIYTDGAPIYGLSNTFREIGMGYLMFIPLPVLFLIVLFMIAWIILRMNKFGRYIYAVGGNQETTRLAGININMIKIAAYGISSSLAAFAGVVLASRVNSGDPVAGNGYELDVIAAVVIGGTPLSGGQGGVFGTLIGALMLGIIRNGLNLLNVSAYYQTVVIGITIVIAVLINELQKGKR